MSRFFTDTLAALEPYVPGEQPQDMQYVKLNTNESPFPPSPAAMAYGREHLRSLNLYPDPLCRELKEALAETYGVSPDNVFVTNGSDEALYFAFRAFCDERRPAAFADITYGCYTVFADACRVPYEEIPLREDFSIDVEDYREKGRTIVIANPNAPTGLALPAARIEELLQAHPDDVVIVDEAYVDFGAESCIPLISKYPNLLAVQTFSKSRSMAGARLGFAIGDRELIADLEKIRNSFNPYNINSMTMAVSLGVLKDPDYTAENCAVIMENREFTALALRAMGFEVLDSRANFLFARSDRIGGEELYLRLKERGVLVRHFQKERIREFNRISVGTREQMKIFLDTVWEILGGNT